MSEPAELHVAGGRPLRGSVRVPGCKGISHRALLLAALADGPSTIAHLAPGHDVQHTRRALGALGVRTSDGAGGAVRVAGAGAAALAEPASPIDCGNSGSTMRMLAGLCAGRPALSVLVGDASLSRRPMARVVAPLRAMGAAVDGRAGGEYAPIVVRGGALAGVRHALDVPSGQVKTALLLAGLQADGVTEITEPAASRDHTERMLEALGAPVERRGERAVRVRRGAPAAFELEVPGDPSSAAYFVVAACIVPGSSLRLERVDLNPRRVAYLDVLRSMGAAIETVVTGEELGEPVGDVAVEWAPLHGTMVKSEEGIVDELPALAVAGAYAEGTTEIVDAAELAVKESDRIATVVQELGQLGVEVRARGDGLVVEGGRPRAATLKSHGDHRIALAAAVAALGAEGESTVRGWQAVGVSYPGFAAELAALRGVG